MVVAIVPRDLWKDDKSEWACECDCGGFSFVRGQHLREGGTRSCGCLIDEARKASATHGRATTGAYSSWKAMRSRCRDDRHKDWASYGGRGISVCPDWDASFAEFFAHMGDRPEGKSIDRIDVNGDYEPGNCRWATPLEQAHNKR